MPAPPSTKQKEANANAMARAISAARGISTPSGSGSPRNNPTGISRQSSQAVKTGTGNAPSAAARQAVERSQYRSPPGTISRETNNGSQSAVMRHLNMGKPLIRPTLTSAPGSNFPGRPSFPAQNNIYNPTPSDILQARQRQASIPIPRQNPLSDPNKFVYDPGRDRDYIMQGDTSLDPAGEMDQTDVSRLVAMQQRYGEPLRVTSGYRGPKLNRKAKGAPSSTHLGSVPGEAFDIHTDDTSRAAYARLAAAASNSGFEGGYGAYRPGSLHVDTGVPRMWGSNANKKTVMAGLADRSIIAAAGLPPKKQTVASVLAPIVKKGVAGVKSFLNPQEIPIPRMKPAYPSMVAQAGVPIPRMKPQVPEIMGSRGVPIPRMKPEQQMTTITPAGGNVSPDSYFKYNGSPYRPRGVMKNGVLTRDGIDATQEQLNAAQAKKYGTAPPSNTWSNMFSGFQKQYANVNENVLKPIAQGVQNYGVDATQNYVDAKINAMRKGRPSRYARAYGRDSNKGPFKRRPIVMGADAYA